MTAATDLTELSFGSIFRIEHEENTRGNDYVVGDLHGSVHLLEKFMELVNFDKTRDRMFSVGDLPDRGIDSYGTLQLLNEPWFFPVLGNHEQMFYSYAKGMSDGYGYSFLNNGGEWILRQPPNDGRLSVNDLADLLLYVPRVRTVKGKNKVHIVHAEFNLQGIALTDDRIEKEDTLRKLCMLASFDGEFSFWGRSLFNQYYRTQPSMVKHDMAKIALVNSPNLSKIISGHTIVETPLQLGKCLNIDTGAYNKYRNLTVYSITHDLLYQYNFEWDAVKTVEPFVVGG